MGKVEIGIYFCVTADILTKVLQKCSWSSPLSAIWVLSRSLILIGCHGNRKMVAMATERLHFRKKYSKIFFSEAIRGMKLKLCINVHDISLYINCIFYCCCPCAFVAMATYSFHIHVLIMGKVEIGIYFCVTADILTKNLPPPTMWILSKSLILTGGHGNQKAKFSKKKTKKKKHSKIFFSEAIWGMKLKLCIHVHDSSLYINYVLYCCCPCAFVAIASGNWHLFLCYCRYFDKGFTEMFLE